MTRSMVTAAACPDRSVAFPRPFRILAVTTGIRTLDPRSPDGPVDEGQNPAVRSLRRRHRRLPHRGHAARPHRASPVRLPRPQPWPPSAPRHAAHGRLGRRRPPRGEKRAERAAVQAAARSGRRTSPRDGPRSNCSCRRRPSSTSRRPWRAPTGRSPRSRKDGGRRHGVRPGSPITSPPGRSSPGWRRPGSTSGGAGWRRSGCAGWSALPPPASASAARRWRRPRNAPGC